MLKSSGTLGLLSKASGQVKASAVVGIWPGSQHPRSLFLAQPRWVLTVLCPLPPHPRPGPDLVSP